MKEDGVASYAHIAIHLNKPRATVQTFYRRWKQKRRFRGQSGRPPRISPELCEAVIDATIADRRLPVRPLAIALQLSRESVRQIRHKYGYHYYDSIPVPPLTAEAMANRAAFCQAQLARTDDVPIVFTDESTITQNLGLGGLWRMKTEFLEEGTHVEEAHPTAVMVWRAIANNFRSELLQCPPSVNAMSYMNVLAEAHIFYHLIQVFGERGFIWQQDNAPAHGPGLREIMTRYLTLRWPPHSPDLSPIEMIWSVIKRKLRGRKFGCIEELFAATVTAWREIDQSVMNNLVGSFKARCRVCVKYGGACLNGHWAEVHAEHHRADPTNVPAEPDSVEELI
jgi:hypothetical protein